jgi:hypothetical protein
VPWLTWAGVMSAPLVEGIELDIGILNEQFRPF